ncbi:MAG: PIN domain-containing protein [Terracidiphilus sp.]
MAPVSDPGSRDPEVPDAGSRLGPALAQLVSGAEVPIERGGSQTARIEDAPVRPVRTFFDTNILVYADDTSEPGKQPIASEQILHHMRHRSGVVSTQVLQEYFVTVTRKFKADSLRAKEKVELYGAFEVARIDLGDILAAIGMHRLHGFSLWDALVLRMAKQSGCRILLSEDMQHGREIDGVRIVNPFL